MEYTISDEDLSIEFFMARVEGKWPGYLGLTPTHIARDRFEGGFDIEPRHMAPNGFLHAGTVVTLADSLCGYATISNLTKQAAGFTTLELKTNFFSTAKQGRVQGVATPVHIGRTTQVWDCEVRHAETDIRMALFRCTQMILFPKN